MFDFSYNFTLPCQECTAEEFEKLVTSDKVRRAIAKARECEAAIRQLGDDADEMRKQLDAEKAKAKRTLPCIMFQATFDANTEGESPSAPTQKRWRNNKNARLNGLFIVDIDHVASPDLLHQKNMDVMKQIGISDRLMLAFITASGHGLKYVLKADAAIGDIAQNQAWLCEELGIEYDKVCRDAARISYCPSKEDILFINSEIFDYNNEEYDRQFGGKYRGNPLPTSTSGGESSASSNQALPLGGDGGGLGDQSDLSEISFCGVKGGLLQLLEAYTKLFARQDWHEGVPPDGQRHGFVLKMATDLRYACDMERNRLFALLRTSAAGATIHARDPKELERIVDGALSYKSICGYPQSVRMACKNCGIELPYWGPREIIDEDNAIDYDLWSSRLLPLLHPDNPRDIYARAIGKMDDKIKLGAVLVAGAMVGTYLTNCYFQHYDARLYRLSYLVYVIGPPACGKSFLVDLDKVLMYNMKQKDETYRVIERQYEEKKEMISQTKGAKPSEVEPRPHMPIRYIPSSTSNNVLYRRLRDAINEDDPNCLHMHLFTTESELATALRAQTGSWAGKQDLELKSFQNEYAGVDFANSGSANGLLQINWNQCVSSTMSSVNKKLRGQDLDDGFITRLALWWMPPTEGDIIDYKGDKPVLFDDINMAPEDMGIVEMCQELEGLSGRIECEPLVRCAWEWCREQTELVRIDGDKVRDYFRKRIPLYMVRYTLPRMVCMQYEEFKKTGKLEVTEEDKQFARLIGDWLMYISIRVWGNRLTDMWDNVAEVNKPRTRQSGFAEKYMSLPQTFTIDEIEKLYSSRKSAQTIISMLVSNKTIEKVAKNTWRKLRNVV